MRSLLFTNPIRFPDPRRLHLIYPLFSLHQILATSACARRIRPEFVEVLHRVRGDSLVVVLHCNDKKRNSQFRCGLLLADGLDSCEADCCVRILKTPLDLDYAG